MAHGLNSVIKRGSSTLGCKSEGKTGVGSRRIFAPHFKLQVLDSYRNDADCKGNQRATARKYGIHRRQIQKWLQAENNLRNSINKGKSNEAVVNPEARKCGFELALRNTVHGRQRDDSCVDACYRSAGGSDTRVPALSPASSPDTPPAPAPLDFTTHSRGPEAYSPPLSRPDPSAPMDLSLKRPTSPAAPVCYAPLSPPRPSPQSSNDSPDAWDLSTKGCKRAYDPPLHSPSSGSSLQSTPKPVKLFKPYLDDLTSECSEDSCPKFTELTPPCCANSSYICDAYYYNNYNNNNNICDYTFHELQPKRPVGYFYAYQEYEPVHFCAPYEEAAMVPQKQRQSYSLDFKLSAIECYYRDAVCRGNQRAVASKYNIHRRQVQKWLQQEEELRKRNASVKQIHAVR